MARERRSNQRPPGCDPGCAPSKSRHLQGFHPACGLLAEPQPLRTLGDLAGVLARDRSTCHNSTPARRAACLSGHADVRGRQRGCYGSGGREPPTRSETPRFSVLRPTNLSKRPRSGHARSSRRAGANLRPARRPLIVRSGHDISDWSGSRSPRRSRRRQPCFWRRAGRSPPCLRRRDRRASRRHGGHALPPLPYQGRPYRRGRRGRARAARDRAERGGRPRGDIFALDLLVTLRMLVLACEGREPDRNDRYVDVIVGGLRPKRPKRPMRPQA
jgi:hypothetical protein